MTIPEEVLPGASVVGTTVVGLTGALVEVFWHCSSVHSTVEVVVHGTVVTTVTPSMTVVITVDEEASSSVVL